MWNVCITHKPNGACRVLCKNLPSYRGRVGQKLVSFMHAFSSPKGSLHYRHSLPSLHFLVSPSPCPPPLPCNVYPSLSLFYILSLPPLSHVPLPLLTRISPTIPSSSSLNCPFSSPQLESISLLPSLSPYHALPPLSWLWAQETSQECTLFVLSSDLQCSINIHVHVWVFAFHDP